MGKKRKVRLAQRTKELALDKDKSPSDAEVEGQNPSSGAAKALQICEDHDVTQPSSHAKSSNVTETAAISLLNSAVPGTPFDEKSKVFLAMKIANKSDATVTSNSEAGVLSRILAVVVQMNSRLEEICLLQRQSHSLLRVLLVCTLLVFENIACLIEATSCCLLCFVTCTSSSCA